MTIRIVPMEETLVWLLRTMGYAGQFGDGQITNYSGGGGIDGVINEYKLGLDVVRIRAKRWQDDGIQARVSRRSTSARTVYIRAELEWRQIIYNG